MATYMTVADAQALAYAAHLGRVDRVGHPEIEHITWVAEHCPEEDRVAAWLHDAVEDGLLSFCSLVDDHNIGPVDCGALLLLTRLPTQTYREYIHNIAVALGAQGARARVVKSFDLNHNRIRECPPEMRDMRAPAGRYAKAQRVIRFAQVERGEEITGLSDREIAEMTGINPLAFPA